MELLAVTLSIIYLLIRLNFNNTITNKNAKKEIRFLIIGNTLLIISAALYYLVSPITHILAPLLVMSILFSQVNTLWNENEKIIHRILPFIFVPLLFVPYLNIIGSIILVAYIIMNRKKQHLEMLGFMGFSFTVLLASIFHWDSLIWIGVNIFYIFKHLSHTSQLVEMLQNAGKNVVTDYLTGLYNRHWLIKRANQLAEKQKIGIIFFDIDDFKKLNDKQGHEYGDYVLQRTAEIIMRELKGNGYGCRYGGEEIVGLVYNYGRTLGIAERILELVRKELNITMSIGIAIGEGNAEELVNLADKRMYISKTSGKNKITYENSLVKGEQND